MAKDDIKSQDNISLPANIILGLQTEGFDDTERKMNDILKAQRALGYSQGDLVKKYGGVEEATKALIKAYKTKGKIATDALSKEEKAVSKLRKAYNGLGSGIHEVAGGLKKMVLPSGFGSAITLTDQYNKSLMQSSASVNRLGIGLKGLETSLTRIGTTTSLTRTETFKLFDQFQSGMREISISDFESTMKRMRNIVGSNADAMGKMQDSLSAISQEYPSLSRGLLDLAKADSVNNAAQQESLQNRVRNLYFIGKISDAQYRQVSSYLSGNKQISSADSQRQKDIKEQIKATQELKRQMEYIGLAVGQAVLPILVKVSDVFRDITKSSETAAGSMKKVGYVLGGLMLAKGAYSFGKGSLKGAVSLGRSSAVRATGRNIAGSGIGRGVAKVGGGVLSGIGKFLAKRGGVAGKFGKMMSGAGKAGITLGAEGTHVFVTNWPGAGGKIHSIEGTSAAMQRQLGYSKSKGVNAGVFGKAKGLFGSKIKMGSVLKSGGAALALGVGSYYGKKYGKKFEEAGKVKTGGALSLGGSLASVGSAAATGAMIGSLVPVVGTALGGIAGGILGAAKEWKNLAPAFMKMIGQDKGKSKKENQFQKDFEKQMKEEEDKIKEEKSLQDRIEKGNKKNLKDVEKMGMAAVFQRSHKESKEANEDLAKKREAVDVEIGSKLGMSFKEGNKQQQIRDKIADQENVVNKAKERYAKNQLDMSKEERQGAQEFIKLKEKELQDTEDIVKEVEDSATGYQKALTTATALSGQLETMVMTTQKQKDIVATMGSLYEAQAGYLSSVVQKMSITGNVDYSTAKGDLEKSLKYLDSHVVASENLINNLKARKEMMKSEGGPGGEVNVKEQLDKNLSKEDRIYWKSLDKAGVKTKDIAEVETEIKKEETSINQAVQKRIGLMLEMVNLMEGQLKYAGATATQAGLMVQLADNYAIGVGASAAQRIKQFKAEEKNIAVLKEQLKINRNNQAVASAEQKLALVTQEAELQNQILQSQIKQAGQVKALRDGWVSAISAMNTGFGTFSEIVMDANQGLAQLQRLPGSLRTPIHGAFAKQGEDIGYKTSERMTTQGFNGIGNIYSSRYGKSSAGKGLAPYVSYGDEKISAATGQIANRETIYSSRNIESGQRGIAAMQIAAERTTGSGGLGLGFNNAISQAAWMEGATYGSGIVGEEAKGGAKTRKPEFSMQGGIMSIPMKPGKVSEGSKVLVVNKERKAVPVFIVNWKDGIKIGGDYEGSGSATGKDGDPTKTEKEEKNRQTIQKREEKRKEAGVSKSIKQKNIDEGKKYIDDQKKALEKLEKEGDNEKAKALRDSIKSNKLLLRGMERVKKIEENIASTKADIIKTEDSRQKLLTTISVMKGKGANVSELELEEKALSSVLAELGKNLSGLGADLQTAHKIANLQNSTIDYEKRYQDQLSDIIRREKDLASRKGVKGAYFARERGMAFDERESRKRDKKELEKLKTQQQAREAGIAPTASVGMVREKLKQQALEKRNKEIEEKKQQTSTKLKDLEKRLEDQAYETQINAIKQYEKMDAERQESYVEKGRGIAGRREVAGLAAAGTLTDTYSTTPTGLFAPHSRLVEGKRELKAGSNIDFDLDFKVMNKEKEQIRRARLGEKLSKTEEEHKEAIANGLSPDDLNRIFKKINDLKADIKETDEKIARASVVIQKMGKAALAKIEKDYEKGTDFEIVANSITPEGTVPSSADLEVDLEKLTKEIVKVTASIAGLNKEQGENTQAIKDSKKQYSQEVEKQKKPLQNQTEKPRKEMAEGGIVTSPTNILAGEAGPEAIIPLAKLPQILGPKPTTVSAPLAGGFNIGESLDAGARKIGQDYKEGFAKLQSPGPGSLSWLEPRMERFSKGVGNFFKSALPFIRSDSEKKRDDLHDEVRAEQLRTHKDRSLFDDNVTNYLPRFSTKEDVGVGPDYKRRVRKSHKYTPGPEVEGFDSTPDRFKDADRYLAHTYRDALELPQTETDWSKNIDTKAKEKADILQSQDASNWQYDKKNFYGKEPMSETSWLHNNKEPEMDWSNTGTVEKFQPKWDQYETDVTNWRGRQSNAKKRREAWERESKKPKPTEPPESRGDETQRRIERQEDVSKRLKRRQEELKSRGKGPRSKTGQFIRSLRQQAKEQKAKQRADGQQAKEKQKAKEQEVPPTEVSKEVPPTEVSQAVPKDIAKAKEEEKKAKEDERYEKKREIRQALRVRMGETNKKRKEKGLKGIDIPSPLPTLEEKKAAEVSKKVPPTEVPKTTIPPEFSSIGTNTGVDTRTGMSPRIAGITASPILTNLPESSLSTPMSPVVNLLLSNLTIGVDVDVKDVQTMMKQVVLKIDEKLPPALARAIGGYGEA